MKPQLAYLLAGFAVCMAGLALSLILLSRDRRRIRQRDQRIEDTASTYRVIRGEKAADDHHLELKLQGATLLGQAERLLRYDRTHLAIYPARPGVVLLIAMLPAVVLAAVAANFIGRVGWVVTPFGALFLCRSFYGWCQNRHMATLFKQFPDALAMIVRAVRVGLPIVEALRVVARENPEPTAREFAALVAQTSIGVPLEDALREMAERNRLPEYRFFATSLSLQSQTGGGLAETLDNLAETIRKRLAAKMRGHALAAEARMSSYILGALPIVAGALLALTNPSYISVLFIDPSGFNLLLTAIMLLVFGSFTMRMLIRKSLS